MTNAAVPVTVTASSATVTYGDPVPAITPSYTGFTGGQTDPAPRPTCTTTATSSSPVGTYPTTCSGAADPNFDFDYVDGSITITPAPATVTASSDTFTYGGTVPAITADATRASSTVTPLRPRRRPAPPRPRPSSPVGSYPSACTGAADPNYTFSTVAGTVDVTKAELTVTASDGTFVYGGSVPAITAVLLGLRQR